MKKEQHFKTRVRVKGQITIPTQVRELLHLNEGDGLIFFVKEGRVIIEREQTVDPEIAWFWSDRWQHMEQAAQAEIDSGKVQKFDNVEDAISALKDLDSDADH